MAVLDEIREERRRQDAQWGKAHDDQHTLTEWFELINERFFDPTRASRGTTRRHLIEIAAIAVAAAESMDRNEAAAQAERSE